MKILNLKSTLLIVFILFIVGKSISKEAEPRIIMSAGTWGDRSKPCKTKARKIDADINLGTGGGLEIGSNSVPLAHDCSKGQDPTCQVINCEGRTLVVLVHED